MEIIIKNFWLRLFSLQTIFLFILFIYNLFTTTPWFFNQYAGYFFLFIICLITIIYSTIF